METSAASSDVRAFQGSGQEQGRTSKKKKNRRRNKPAKQGSKEFGNVREGKAAQTQEMQQKRERSGSKLLHSKNQSKNKQEQVKRHRSSSKQFHVQNSNNDKKSIRSTGQLQLENESVKHAEKGESRTTQKSKAQNASKQNKKQWAKKKNKEKSAESRRSQDDSIATLPMEIDSTGKERGVSKQQKKSKPRKYPKQKIHNPNNQIIEEEVVDAGAPMDIDSSNDGATGIGADSLDKFINEELSNETTAQGGHGYFDSLISSTTREAFTKSKYKDCNVMSNRMKHNVTVKLKYEFMTKVQKLAIPVAITGKDCLVKAKTGTGKTVAFLVPSIDRVLQHTSLEEREGKVQVLIISPTRELASQIEAEAKPMVFGTQLTVQVVVGGTSIERDRKIFRKLKFPDILVATPGRLIDHLQSDSGLKKACDSLKCLIFDEADRLLEMGFRPVITELLRQLPPKKTRQTLLFSATMPEDTMDIAKFALRDKFESVDAVGTDQDTHKHIEQICVVHKPEYIFAELLHVLKTGMKVKNFKIIVFFVTARLTQLFAEVFNKLGINVLEIHSRKSQAYRNRVSTAFRSESEKIMFSSDVSARGLDYPDISMVIQIGMPSDKAQYVHRIGRTARIGKGGKGIIMLSDFEDGFLKEVKDQAILIKRSKLTDEEIEPVLQRIKTNMTDIDSKSLLLGYQSWLGYYNSNTRRLKMSKAQVVQQANNFATAVCGMKAPPTLEAKIVRKMGLTGVEGLHVAGKGSNGGEYRAGNSKKRGRGMHSNPGKRGAHLAVMQGTKDRGRAGSQNSRNRSQSRGGKRHRRGK